MRVFDGLEDILDRILKIEIERVWITIRSYSSRIYETSSSEKMQFDRLFQIIVPLFIIWYSFVH